MTIDLRLMPSHDLQLSDTGDLVVVNGAERIAQQIKVTLLTFLGEWFLDLTFGVPYLEQVLAKSPRPAILEPMFRTRIVAVPGVRRVRKLNLKFDPQARLLMVSLEAETDEGLVVQSVALDTNKR